MTVEAAVTKLAYVLSRDDWTLEQKKTVSSIFGAYYFVSVCTRTLPAHRNTSAYKLQKMAENLRGELTTAAVTREHSATVSFCWLRY